MAHINAAIQIVNIARIVYAASVGDDIEITKKRLIHILQHAIYVAHSINNGIVTIIDDQIEKMKNLICDNQNFQLLADTQGEYLIELAYSVNIGDYEIDIAAFEDELAALQNS